MLALRSPALRMAALGLLLALLLPFAAAQAPPVAPPQFVGFAVVCPQQMIEVDYRGVKQTTCFLHDLTRDSGAVEGLPTKVSTLPHTTTLALDRIEPNGTVGWQVQLSHNFVPTMGGDVVPITFSFLTTPQINEDQIRAIVNATYVHPQTGQRLNQTLVFDARVNRYDIAHVRTLTPPARAGQFDIVRYQVAVSNDGVFPDVYRIEVVGPRDFKVSQPPNLYVPPLETRVVNISILTPQGKLYELGRPVTFDFKVRSTYGTGSYSSVGLLRVSGPYVPSYWIPLTLVALVSLVVTTRATRERIERRRLERGRPRRVAVTPKQAVLLAELKRSDPDAYAQRKAQLDAVYAGRRARYRDAYREQQARDREERKLARAEFIEKKKQRKLDRKAEKLRLKAEAKAAKKQAKLGRKETKLKEKELKKKTKLLGKARAKQAKLDAKQAKRDAKAQAKADKLAAKEAKAAAKAAKKAAKNEEKP